MPVSDKWTSIRYSEEFRRAKRNVLIWSGLTVAASIGKPLTQIDDRNLITIFSTNLTFPKYLIVASFFLIAFYFFIEYLRDARHVRLMNLPFIDEDTVTSPLMAFASLSRLADSFQKEFEQARDRVQQQVSRINKMRSQYDEQISWWGTDDEIHQEKLKNSIDELNRLELSDEKDFDQERSKFVENSKSVLKLIEEHWRRLRSKEKMALRHRDELVEINRQEFEVDAPDYSAWNDLSAPLEEVAGQLRGFGSQVRSFDKIFWYAMDIGVVVLLFLAAAAVTVSELLRL